MMDGSAGRSSPKPGDGSPSPRVARRRAARQKRLLAIAARRFAEQGLGARLDDIAGEYEEFTSVK